jgi:hypothetical protein
MKRKEAEMSISLSFFLSNLKKEAFYPPNADTQSVPLSLIKIEGGKKIVKSRFC